MLKCLLIVDVQNDFLPGGALAITGGDQIIPVINQIQPLFDHIVATKDWHPPNHISFASRHHKKPGEIIELNEGQQELWPDHCIQFSDGADFSNSLHAEKIQKIFFKGIDPELDSYSAFFDNSHIRSTGLGEYLKSLNITDIYIAGLATDYCVKYSAIDGLNLGFHVNIVLDACQGIDLHEGDIQKAIQFMQDSGARMIFSKDLI